MNVHIKALGASLLMCLLFKGVSVRCQEHIVAAERGNWYEKLQWWKKAKPAYEQVKSQVEHIQRAVRQLEQAKIGVQEQLSNWLSNLRITLDQLQEKTHKQLQLYQEKLHGLEEEASQGITDEEEDTITVVTQIIDKLKFIEQHLELLLNLRNRLTQTLSQAQQQSKIADNYLDISFDNFEKIEKIFDDKKARELYEQIETNEENVQLILRYIQVDLKNYLSTLSQQFKRISQAVSDHLKQLEQYGVVLRNLSPAEIEARERQKQQAQKLAEQKKLQQAAEQAEAQRSWWDQLTNWLYNLLS